MRSFMGGGDGVDKPSLYELPCDFFTDTTGACRGLEVNVLSSVNFPRMNNTSSQEHTFAFEITRVEAFERLSSIVMDVLFMHFE